MCVLVDFLEKKRNFFKSSADNLSKHVKPQNTILYFEKKHHVRAEKDHIYTIGTNYDHRKTAKRLFTEKLPDFLRIHIDSICSVGGGVFCIAYHNKHTTIRANFTWKIQVLNNKRS